ncbi:MAG: orotidine-5'-phosphate decarboxylase [Desulfobacterales bacterium]|nr:orotidine-5'-phosphate decarboxylase [Desulfobacterales bacterium]
MKQPKDYIIFPLDLASFEEAQKYVLILSDCVGMFKIGLELFIRSGRKIVEYIKETSSVKIFLDLKLHDIPTTVHRAMSIIKNFDVSFVTVHCGESQKMLEAAVEGSEGKVNILGVTVLTNISSDDIKHAGYKEEFWDLSHLVLKKAKSAKEAGFAGVICSGYESKMIKDNIGKEFIAVTPGIRPLWGEIKKDDQHRIITPSDAIERGSDYIVIGRPIRDAKDPQEAALKIAKEIEEKIKTKVNS